MSETSEQLILDSLKKIDNKLDRHDVSFISINKTLAKLVAVDIEIREIKHSVGRVFDRVESIEEEHKTTGCSVFQSFVRVRQEQLKKYDNTIEIFDDRLNKVEVKVGKIENVPNRIMFGATIAVISAIASAIFGFFILKHGGK